MYPKYHIIINFILSLILLSFLNPAYVLIFFLASFLIDFDHYIYYVLEEKDFSLKKAFKWFIIKKQQFIKMSKEERKLHKNWFLVFHGVEVLALLLILSYSYNFFFYIFLGFLAHMIEDLFEDIPLGVAERKLFLSYAIYKHFTSENH